jgi:glycerol kinase
MLQTKLSPRLGGARRFRSLLAAIDQGTSSSRVLLYDEKLAPVASHQVELASATENPKPGWSQMDPKAIVSSVEVCAAGALAKAGATASDVVGVGITTQRETTIVWDKRTGEPLHPAILWHDARTSDTSRALCDALGGQDALRGVCGLPISTYFSGVKLRWLMEHVPAVRAGIEGGTALFGTVDSWLAWNLTGSAGGARTRHVTDVTNASRTMMMVRGPPRVCPRPAAARGRSSLSSVAPPRRTWRPASGTAARSTRSALAPPAARCRRSPRAPSRSARWQPARSRARL